MKHLEVVEGREDSIPRQQKAHTQKCHDEIGLGSFVDREA